jgi:maleylacetate reductase
MRSTVKNMHTFTYECLPSRVLFGVDSIDRLPEEVERLGAMRVLILHSPHFGATARALGARLGDRLAGLYEGAALHVPIDAAEAVRAVAHDMRADCCVAIGGGSTIGLAKAIALDAALPIIAVPTTYAGSEMTPIWGLTEHGEKRTGRDGVVLPRVVVYDPRLTLGLPAHISGPSGINALAHCVEALYAPDTNPIVTLIAQECVRALTAALPRVVASPDNLEARSDMLHGAWLAGVSLGAVSMGLHHKLCHVLGGSFNLPHAEVHAIILPQVVHYNQDAAPQVMQHIARALDVPHAARGVFDLVTRLGIPTALREVGMRAQDLDAATELALRSPYANPTPVTRDGIRRLLDAAYYGHPPGGEERALAGT